MVYIGLLKVIYKLFLAVYQNKENIHIKTTKNYQILHFTIRVIKEEYVKCKTYFWYVLLIRINFIYSYRPKGYFYQLFLMPLLHQDTRTTTMKKK